MLTGLGDARNTVNILSIRVIALALKAQRPVMVTEMPPSAIAL